MPDAAWKLVTTSSVSSHCAWSTARTSIIVITVAPGLAMIPFGPVAHRLGVDLGDDERHERVAPEGRAVVDDDGATARPPPPAHSAEISGGMSTTATSTPSKNSGVRASTVRSSPATRQTDPDVLGPGGEAHLAPEVPAHRAGRRA